MSKVNGRPTKYKPEYCAMLIKHMKDGFSFESFSATVNVHRESLYEWAKRHKDFSEAKKQGYELCQKFWEHLYILAATGKMKGASASLIIFKMKCSFGYKDGTEVNKQSDVKDDSNKVWNTKWRDKTKTEPKKEN